MDDVEAGEEQGESREKPATLGDYIRGQRRLANLSLRQLARVSEVSDSYLSQVERGIYRPSADVLKAIAEALDVSARNLYAHAGLLDEIDDNDPESRVEDAIRHDPRLSPKDKEALLHLYRTLADGDGGAEGASGDASARNSQEIG